MRFESDPNGQGKVGPMALIDGTGGAALAIDRARSRIAESGAAFSGWMDLGVQNTSARPLRQSGPNGFTSIEAPGLLIHLDSSRIDSDVGDATITLCSGSPRSGDI